MTDKERIEKLLLTIMGTNKALYLLRQMVDYPGNEDVVGAVQTMIDTNNYVISQNADQIKLDL